MKLIVTMTVDSNAETLEHLMMEHDVAVFSETSIQGFRKDQIQPDPRNWFEAAHGPVYSRLTFAFVTAEKADELLDAIASYNRDQDLERPIRAFQMDVEKSIPT